MNKEPRICEILGFKVDEVFLLMGDEAKIQPEGALVIKHGSKWVEASADIWRAAINYPEVVRRKPRWTAEDITDAKAVRRLFPAASEVYRTHKNSIMLDNCLHLYGDIFPSLQVGEHAELDEVLEAETDGRSDI